jgi:hypothetical protein
LGRHQFNCDSLQIMLIVILTRYDLRDEFAMADEAFALSPISARAQLPSEQDYDAIREAFMETARGRWFLGEYGKRNRNADTSMVLDAVARIEATIAAHKQAPANELPDALVLIRGLLSDAKDNAARTMSGPDAEQALAAVDKATRIIREIAWTLREYGTDARICDMLDAQVKAIEASHQHTIAADKRDAVLATFDLLIRRIGELGGSGAAPPSSDSETAPSPSAADDAPAATAEPAEAAAPRFETAAEAVAQAAVEVAAMPDEIGTTTHDTAAHDAPEVPSQLSETPVAELTTPAADVVPAATPEADVVAATDAETTSIDFEIAQDMAVLDAIALEMAEPEIAGFDLAEPSQTIEPDMVKPSQTVEPNMVESSQTVESDRVEPAIVEQVPETAIAPEQDPEPQTPSQPSLGAALIASGILSRSSAAQDTLAPLRRMTQAERIAFFS